MSQQGLSYLDVRACIDTSERMRESQPNRSFEQHVNVNIQCRIVQIFSACFLGGGFVLHWSDSRPTGGV